MKAMHGIDDRRDEDWGDRVREITGGTGVDHVVKAGGPSTLAQSIKAARAGGHIALTGVLTGRAGAVQTAMLMARQQRLPGADRRQPPASDEPDSRYRRRSWPSGDRLILPAR